MLSKSTLLETLRRYTTYDAARFEKFLSVCKGNSLLGRVLNLVFALLFLARRFLLQMLKSLAKLKRQLLQHVPKRQASPFQHLPPHGLIQNLTSNSKLTFGAGVLIIADLGLPQCRRYRVMQKTLCLNRRGLQTEVVTFEDPHSCWQLLPHFQKVIFYRVPFSPQMGALLQECKRLGISTFFDIDDLVFDLELYRAHPFFKKSGRLLRNAAIEKAVQIRETLLRCDHALASTEAIAVSLRECVPGKVFVIENALDHTLLALSSQATSPAPQKLITLGYGSGTKSHDDDFELIAGALSSILKRHAHVRLTLHGYLQLPKELAEYSDRILFIPFLETEDYFQAIGLFTINLSPLVNNAFNDAKSNIKFLEAAAFAIPTIASPRAEFSRAIVSGVNGILAETEEEWIVALETLITNPGLRFQMGQAAKSTAMAMYHPDVIGTHLKSALDLIEAPKTPAVRNRRILFVTPRQAHNDISPFGASCSFATPDPDLDIAILRPGHFPKLPLFAVVKSEHLGVPILEINLPQTITTEQQLTWQELDRSILRILVAFTPDCVLFDDVASFGLSLISLCQAKGFRTAVTPSEPWLVCARRNMTMAGGSSCGQWHIDPRICAPCTGQPALTFNRYFTTSKMLAKIDLLIVSNESQKDFYHANGAPLDNISVIAHNDSGRSAALRNLFLQKIAGPQFSKDKP
jgi:glycosyltransferase involved in cell wall biosynthesis